MQSKGKERKKISAFQSFRQVPPIANKTYKTWAIFLSPYMRWDEMNPTRGARRDCCLHSFLPPVPSWQGQERGWWPFSSRDWSPPASSSWVTADPDPVVSARSAGSECLRHVLSQAASPHRLLRAGSNVTARGGEAVGWGPNFGLRGKLPARSRRGEVEGG